jgi:small subunit ribosomal protein S16
LKRMGTKGRPFYRIVAAPTSAGRDGRFVEQLGHYDPLQEPSLVKVDKERVLHWLKNGASPSDTLIRLLKKEGIWEEFEGAKPEKKPRRKPVQARVKKEKPVKEKKRKPVAAAEPSGEVSEPSGEVSESAGEVSESPGEVSESAGEVSELAGEVSEPSGEVSESPGEVSESPGEVSEPSGEVSEEPAK